ncbi:putative quinone oxidoreductase [Hyphomonas polymorpha PS728]|uniref:Putative quinone oxidoreductase n=1 Tax=Hyphomonas polymorpha PS728 TaxID=1280954 RepID=A0A062VHB8_9PROT|nr:MULTISPECIES: NADPH:quinone oxidoreductase family protein [Hyphomonas]AXE65723.1 NADPH:quinone oxidoreductase [Hyphomonas sp. CACIAM 19H1]KCZ97449.1 putative quinone oxidoreductase [Hyphomonas polymorpha PS728]
MKAVLSKVVGGPETLVIEDVPVPTPGKGQVLVQVKACGVNYPDVLIIQDMYQFKPPRPFSPGGEVAGIVSAVGEGVAHVKPGDRVLASTGNGGMAEYCLAPAHGVMPIPEGMPFEEAAAFLMTYGTSYYAIKDRGDPKPGEKLLVLGAAGGVGIAAVELGKAMGLEVIAACSSQEKVDFCLSKGADKGLVYERELDRDGQKKFSDDIKAVSGGGVDIIYDGVGGNYAEPAVRAMNWEGRFLVIGFPAGIPKLPLNLTLLKSCDVRGVFWGAAVARDPKAHQQNVKELFDLYKAGKIRPHVSNTYPMEQAADAIRELQDRKAQGKVVVTM